MPDPAKAFVSYSRKDAEFVLRLCQDLRNAGGAIWLDQLDIQPGEEWDQEIQRGLAECGRMVVVLSPHSVESQNVMDEVGYALSKKKRIFPVLYQDCEMPYRLNRLHYADFRTDYDKGLRDLLTALAEAPNVEVKEAAPGLPNDETGTHSDPPPGKNLYLLAAIAIAAILIWVVFGRRPVPPSRDARVETPKAEQAQPNPPAPTTPAPAVAQNEPAPPTNNPTQPAAKDSSTAKPKKAPGSFRDTFRTALLQYIAEAPSGFQKLGAQEFVDWKPSVRLPGAINCRGSGYPREPVIECILYRTNSEAEAAEKLEDLIELTQASLPDWEGDRINFYNAFFSNKKSTSLVRLGAAKSADRFEVELSVRRRR